MLKMLNKALGSDIYGAEVTEGFHIIKFKHKMDAKPSFGVTMISEVPPNTQN